MVECPAKYSTWCAWDGDGLKMYVESDAASEFIGHML